MDRVSGSSFPLDSLYIWSFVCSDDYLHWIGVLPGDEQMVVVYSGVLSGLLP